MNRISKPDLVDLLRISDRLRWFNPRIRYASIRSKPALIADLKIHFAECITGQRLHFLPRHMMSQVPSIVYDLKIRKFLFDEEIMDVPTFSREKPRFSIRKEKVTVSIP